MAVINQLWIIGLITVICQSACGQNTEPQISARSGFGVWLCEQMFRWEAV